jgi:hypothetical protein
MPQIPGAKKGRFLHTLYWAFAKTVGWTWGDVSPRDRRNAVPDFYTVDVDKMEVCVYEVNDTHRPSPHKYDELYWLLSAHGIELNYINIEADTGYIHEVDVEATSLIGCKASLRCS